MRKLTLLTFAAMIATAAPAMAQETAPVAPAAPWAVPAAPEPDPAGEAALEARAELFKGQVEAMVKEMQTAITDAGGDKAKADADLDAIVARHQPEVDAFAAQVETFITAQAAVAPAEEREGMIAEAATAVARIKTLPTLVRTQLQQEAAARVSPQ